MTIEHQAERIEASALGAAGEPCAHCGAPLASDQRYCLECGTRRADARLPFRDVLEERIRREIAVPSGSTQPRRPVSLAQMAAGAGVLAFALVLGILIGAAGEEAPPQVAAAPPQVISVATPASGQPVAREEFKSDWPAGRDGYTVQLRALPKDGADAGAVQAAKSDAQSKGASDVGALDSDEFSSLDPGSYVIYSGVFESRKRAKRALGRLKRDFPEARIVTVSAGGGGLTSEGDKDALSGKKKEATVGKSQLKELQKLSPEEYQKKAKKLPDTTKLPGKAPPKDEKQPGGGSKGDVVE